MEFETLKRSHLKRNIIIGIAVITIISAVILTFTRAKYRVTQSIPLVNGAINYSSKDLNTIAVYIENEEGYTKTDQIPESGYVFNESESYCTIDGEKNANIKLSYNVVTNSLSITPMTSKGTKCYLYFRYPINIPELIESKVIDQRNDFNSVLTANTTGTIFEAEDDDGTSYYFAGAVDDNYVEFGGFYWRIIRINGNGSMRMIYQGTSPSSRGEEATIGISDFNEEDNSHDNAYVGYMYGTPGSSTYEETHANINDSTIKRFIDNWYANNLSSYESYLDKNSGFCGDRELESGLGYNTSETHYAAYNRVYVNVEKKPTLKCANPERDLYTVAEANKGNQALTYPIGLITADEISYAGGLQDLVDDNDYNYSFYLWIGDVFIWSMTPCEYGSGRASSIVLAAGGHITGTSNAQDGQFGGVRPVINLKSDITFTGSGTASNPYIIN